MLPIPKSLNDRKRPRPTEPGFEPLSAILPRALALIARRRRETEQAWLQHTPTPERSQRLDRLLEGERALRDLLIDEEVA